MIMKFRTATITLLVTSAFAGNALADKLPKDAVKLSASEVQALYADKTSDWSRINSYFAPDGKYLLVGKNGQFLGEGRWSVKDNEMCTDVLIKGVKDGGSKKFKDCWAWYKQGAKYWTLWSGEKNKKSGYYSNELQKLLTGDKVSKKYEELSSPN
jgi:hypothetical protein